MRDDPRQNEVKRGDHLQGAVTEDPQGGVTRDDHLPEVAMKDDCHQRGHHLNGRGQTVQKNWRRNYWKNQV